MLRFSPDVMIDPFWSSTALLIEVSRTSRHFDGEQHLLQRILKYVGDMGCQAVMAVAARPAAASVLSRRSAMNTIRRVGHSALPEALDALPCSVLSLSKDVLTHLDLAGLKTLGQLNALPRSGLKARLGQTLRHRLDLVYGRLQEPLRRHRAPELLEESISWWPPTQQKSSLLFAAKRLFNQIEAALLQKEEGLAEATLFMHLVHSREEHPLRMRPRRPLQKARDLLALLDNLMEQVQLAGPVDAMRLRLQRKVTLLPEQGLLFTRDGDLAWQDETLQLMDTLESRLGESRVLSPRLRPDHRPEEAYFWQQATSLQDDRTSAPQAPSGLRPLEVVKARRLDILPGKNGAPLEILRGPHCGPLHLISGPERIAAGWWEGRDICRDYYVVQSHKKARLWIYHDRRSDHWYCQGLFL